MTGTRRRDGAARPARIAASGTGRTGSSSASGRITRASGPAFGMNGIAAVRRPGCPRMRSLGLPVGRGARMISCAQPFRVAARLSTGVAAPVGETEGNPTVAAGREVVHPPEYPRPAGTLTPDSRAERMPQSWSRTARRRRHVDLDCLPMVCHLADEGSARRMEHSRSVLFQNHFRWRSGKDSNPQPADQKFRAFAGRRTGRTGQCRVARRPGRFPREFRRCAGGFVSIA